MLDAMVSRQNNSSPNKSDNSVLGIVDEPEVDLQRRFGPYMMWSHEHVLLWAASKKLGDDIMKILKDREVNGQILHYAALENGILEQNLGVQDQRMRQLIIQALAQLQTRERELPKSSASPFYEE
ncbi:hypothetical protein HDU76_010922 [Blyttiomyces sp. JEL0837]|nr:hypothetical protein HDU76_010922 [Blyttiomyces sp. JEL0837]